MIVLAFCFSSVLVFVGYGSGAVASDALQTGGVAGEKAADAY